MSYASCLVSCSVAWRCSSSQLAYPVILCLMQLTCPDVFSLRELFLSEDLDFLLPLLSRSRVYSHCILGYPVWTMCIVG